METVYFEKIQALAAKVAKLQAERAERKAQVKEAEHALSNASQELAIAQSDFNHACELMISDAGGMTTHEMLTKGI